MIALEYQFGLTNGLACTNSVTVTVIGSQLRAAHTPSTLLAAMPYTISSRELNDPLIEKVVLHTFNKFRAPIEHADGTFGESKSKWKKTAQTLKSKYGLEVSSDLLKRNRVSVSVRLLEIATTTRCNVQDYHVDGASL